MFSDESCIHSLSRTRHGFTEARLSNFVFVTFVELKNDNIYIFMINMLRFCYYLTMLITYI